MRVFRSRVLFVAAVAALMASGSLGLAGVAGAAPTGTVFHCTGTPGELQPVINGAAPGSTIKVDGTCNGGSGLYINKDLTLTGPAILDGGGIGPALNVMTGTVVLNDLTLQHGAGISNFGGGLWNGGQLTLNRSTVTNNNAFSVGGVFNYGQLTLNNSTVSHNTSTYNGGGIFNCASSFHEFGLCTGAPGTLTLNNSSVSDNVVTSGNGGGILNDQQAVVVLNSSTVSGNAANGGGGIANNGTATINKSTLSGNTGFSGGAINNGMNNDGSGITTASLTLNNSTVQGNRAILLGGAITTSSALTINKSTVSDNSAGPCPGDCFGFGGAGFGGAIFIFSQATTVANSTFANNTAASGLDTPPGILVQAPEFGGTGTFSATHSTFS